jgi:hypothetical protein
MTEPSALEQARSELRERGIHGIDAAKARASEDRFQLPKGEELDALLIFCLERDAFPHRMGQTAGLYFDVMQGWRSLAGAQAVLERDASAASAPPEYCAQLNSIATSLLLSARAEEALTLSTLVGVATDKAYGRTSIEWIRAISLPFVSAMTRTSLGNAWHCRRRT